MKVVKTFHLHCEKKLQAMLILIILVASFNVFSVNIRDVSGVSTSPYIAVVPEKTVDPTITVGMNYTVSIYTDYAGSDIWAWQFSLTYDPDVLQLNYHNKMDTWIGNDTTTRFYTTLSPIVANSETVYVDDVLQIRGTDYTVDSTAGRITFKTPTPGAPASGAEVKAVYTYGVVNGGLISAKTRPIIWAWGPGFNNTSGKLGLTGAGFVSTTATTSGPGTLANVTFTVVGTGYSNVTLGNDTQLIAYNSLTGHPLIIDANEPPGKIEPPYGSDHIGHGYFDNIPNVHDVAVSRLVAPTIAISGNLVPINVTVRNEGNFTDSFDVTVYANTTFVDTQTANLARGTKATLTFDWNTTDAVAGNYIINATALLAEDTDLSDNAKTGQIEIKSHNVAIISLETLAKAIIGDPVPIKVTVRNEGQLAENVTLTIYYGETGSANPLSVVINATNFILAEHLSSKIISVSWNTTSLASGTYRINATATIDIDDVPDDNIKTKLVSLNPPTHDVAVVALSANPLTVIVGEHVTVNVTVRNDGTFNETLVQVNVTYDSTIIDGQSVSLLVGENKTLSFTWDTTGITPNTYSVEAEAILGGDATPTNNQGFVAVDIEAPPPPPPPPGHIAGTVKDVSTGDPIEGANVTANGHFDITDANGQFNITNLQAGTYDVTASATGYEASSQIDITVVAGQTTNLDFTLTPIPTTGHITGIVEDVSTGDPIEGANVTANGHFVLTGEDGSYSIELQLGTYTVTVSADGYEDSSQTGIIVTAGESTTGDFELTPVQAPVEPPNIILYIALAVVAIIIIAGIAIYLLKVKK